MIKRVFWPKLQRTANYRKYYFQQDGYFWGSLKSAAWYYVVKPAKLRICFYKNTIFSNFVFYFRYVQ